MRPRLYEARPETLGVDLLPLLAKTGVRFIAGEATGLELGDGAVVLGTGARVGYDRLVVATGSRMRRPPVPGSEETYSIDTQGEAVAFDRRLGETARSDREAALATVGAGFPRTQTAPAERGPLP